MDSSLDKFVSPTERDTQYGSLTLNIERPLYDHKLLCQDYHYEKPKQSYGIKRCCDIKKYNGHVILKTIPILRWLRTYKWKKDIISDIISGITVAIMHIPQGMAYALLGNMPPIVGIYMAFFPVLIYVLLGTSKHSSLGTFAVACLMTGKVVSTYATPLSHLESGNHSSTAMDSEDTITIENVYTPVQVATAVTFMVGIIQLVMYLFHLGVISSLLSETFVNGFTTGAAVHVLLSQIGDLLGLKLTKQRGYFKCIRTLIVIVNELRNTNLAALTISSVAIVLMTCNNELLKPWAARRCSFPIPIELLAVVIGTLVSSLCDLPVKYDIQTVGYIPTGLPEPTLPAFDLLPSIILDSIAIAMVCYTITMSMSLIFAQKDGYNIDSNQELFALGASNIFSAFFSCMPVSASLSRSLIQHSVGGKTQFASIVSCTILLIILLWIGPYFEPLPRCVLASIIVVALKGMLSQANKFKKFWTLSKYDATVWILTFLSTVLINIDVGLLTGLIASVSSIFIQSVKPDTCLLEQVPSTDLFLDISRFKGVSESKAVKIFRYTGSMNFINERSIKDKLCKAVGVFPEKVMKQRLKLAKRGVYLEDDPEATRCVIMDMSSVTFIDPSGVTALRTVISEFTKIGIPIYLAACSAAVFEAIIDCEKYENRSCSFQMFATVLDAVYFCRREHFSPKDEE